MEQPNHISPPSTFLDLNEEQPQQDHLFNLNTQISSSLSLPPLMINNNRPLDHGEYFYKDPQRFQPPQYQADHKIFSSGGSCDDQHQRVIADQSDQFENSDDLIKQTIWKNNNDTSQDDHHKSHMIMSRVENFDDSSKWTSSKMRMMRKIIVTNPDDHQTISTNDHHHHKPINFTTHKLISDHQAAMMKKHTPRSSPFAAPDHSSSSSSNNNGTIRVCADCNTTKTPLWRSGPRGPKSLCNACGIRQRKARRAMAAAVMNGTIVAVEDAAVAAASTKKASSGKVKHKKEKKTKVDTVNCVTPQFKKRCNNKLTSPSRGRKKKLLCFEDLMISMSKSSAFQRVFPQDEKEAAILLMALSYGLVHG